MTVGCGEQRVRGRATHCDRVLNLLADGEPHSHHEGYALGVILHSRVADLRKRGHVIESWREDAFYLYRLVSPLSERPSIAATGRSESGAALAHPSQLPKPRSDSPTSEVEGQPALFEVAA